MNILDNISTATRVNLQPGDVLFLDIGSDDTEMEDFQLDEIKQQLNIAFGHEVKFILTCGIKPYTVSHSPIDTATKVQI